MSTMTARTRDGRLARDQLISAIDDFSDGFILLGEDLSFRYMNAAAERAFGRGRGEVLGKPFPEAFPTARGSVFEDAFARCAEGRERLDFQTFFGTGRGAKWYDVRVSPWEPGISVRIRELEDRGEEAERDRIVRELSHRVKNSLALIGSLANVESGAIKDAAAKDILERMQGRLHATSLLYDKLARAPGTDSIDVAEYLASLAALIAANFSDGSGRVRIELALSRLELEPGRAAALGLAANEAMTNSFKYAFAGTAEGRLRVELSSSKGRAIFAIEDDGPGFPSGFDPSKDGDLGYALMADKARELGGRLAAGGGSSGRGARVQIDFPV
jgi:PAS domain S-box-containing protein